MIVDLELMFFGRLIDQSGEFGDPVRFRQVVVCTELHRLDRRLDRACPVSMITSGGFGLFSQNAAGAVPYRRAAAC